MKPGWNLLPCLGLFIILAGAPGCGNESPGEQSGQSPQYMSHLEQARFFQSQGQLKASMNEARQAVRIDPGARAAYFIIAETLLISGDADRAIKAFTDLLTVTADAATVAELNQARLGLASAHLLKGQIAEAAVYLDEVSAVSPDEKLLRLELQARIAVARHDPLAAEGFMADALALDPDHIPVNLLRSKQHYYEGNTESAETILAKILDQSPNDAEAWLWKAQMLVAANAMQDAEAAYRKALAEIGQYDVMTLKKYLTISQFTEVLRSLGKNAEADTYQEVLNNSGPGSIRNRYLEALALYRSDLFNEAESALNEILRLAPGHREAGVLAGMVALKKNHWEQAHELLGRYVSEQDDVWAKQALLASQTRIRQNKVLLELRKTLPDAVRSIPVRYGMEDLSMPKGSTPGELENLQRNNPSDSAIAQHLVLHYLLADQAQEALPIVEAWSDNHTDDSQIHHLLAVAVWQQTGRPDYALGVLDNWPAADDAGKALAENARGLVLQANDSIKARDSFKLALRKNPALKAARINLIDFEIARQNWKAAMLHLRRALALHPENVFFLDAFLQTAVMLDDIPARLRWLEESGTTSKAPEPFILLADYYLRMDETAEASLVLQRARPFMTDAVRLWYADVDIRLSTALALQAVAQGDKITARKHAAALENAYPEQIEARLSAVKIAFAMNEASEGHKINLSIKKAFPAAPEPYEIEGDFHSEAGHVSLAAAAYQEAWTLQPKFALACKIRDMRIAENQTEKALEPLEEWLRLYPNDVVAMNEAAMGYLTREQDLEAEAWYRKLLQLQPDNALAYNNLAWIYLRQGNQEAFQIAEKAYQLDPDNEAIADTYAFFLFEKGARNPALGIIQEALRKHPTSLSLRKRLTQIRQPAF